MHKDMGVIMKDMESMMRGMSDPAMKKDMQKMHDQMGGMMKQIGGGTTAKQTTATPSSASGDHDEHHE